MLSYMIHRVIHIPIYRFVHDRSKIPPVEVKKNNQSAGAREELREETGRSQRDVDWEVVDIANRSLQMKKRANAKRALKRLLNGVSSALVERIDWLLRLP